MAGDLFLWLDSLWTKESRGVSGQPPIYIMHRFLASDQDLAPVARALGRDMSDPRAVLHTWQAILPQGRSAPRLAYPAAKKGAAAEALVKRMMVVRNVRREVAEAELDLITLTGREVELYLEFGVEVPGELSKKAAKVSKRKRKKKVVEEPKPATGLLGIAG